MMLAGEHSCGAKLNLHCTEGKKHADSELLLAVHLKIFDDEDRDCAEDPIRDAAQR